MIKVLWKTFYFDAAHKLDNYEGKCKFLHGHQWRADVGIIGNVQSEGNCEGMIIDFSELKKIMNVVIDKLDHHYLNDIISNPTAENIIDFLQNEIEGILPENLILYGLNLYESPDSHIELINI